MRARSTHREAAELLAEKWAQTTEGAQNLALSYLTIRDESLAGSIGVMGQPYNGWDMGQIFALHCLMTMFIAGHLAIVQFEMPSAPLKDSDRDGNQQILQSLPGHVTATVDMSQRGAEGDGYVEWEKPLSGIIRYRETGVRDVSVEPAAALLEIGYTDASNMCLQLARHGAIARWPHGQPFITIVAQHPPRIMDKWHHRNPAPQSPVLADMMEFLGKIILTRLSRKITWGIYGQRPSAEERLNNALKNFSAPP